MKRFVTKRFLAAGLVVAGLLAFAGTCTIQNVSLTNINSHDVFAGELHNDSGANFLGHKVLVAFLDSNLNVVDTKTVTPCLRTLQNGTADFFSVASSEPSSTTSVGLARLVIDSSLKAGVAETGDGTFTNLAISRGDGDTTLHVSGTFTNTDSTTLTEPNVCAVVYTSTNKVVVVKVDTGLNDLSDNSSDTFSIDLDVVDDTSIIDHVDLYADGLKDGVPIAPISDLGNSVDIGTPTPTGTAVPSGTPGAAVKLVFTRQPNGANEGIAFSSQPIVAVEDAGNNVVTSGAASTAPITLAVTVGTGFGGTLTCTTNPKNAVSGSATFAGCNIDLAGQFYTITATSPGLSTAVSAQFNITPVGAATHLGMLVQPGDGTGGSAFSTQPIVTLLDAAGGLAWSSSASVTMAIGNNAGSGTLSGCASNPKSTSSGQAVFSGCKIDKIGTGYTLHFTSGSLTAVDSDAFDVTVGAAAKLAFTTQPGAAAGHASSADAMSPQPQVSVEDAGGNVVTTSTAAVTLAIASGPAATLACTSAGNLTFTISSGGETVFAGCWVNAAGTFTLRATSSGLTSATSTSLVVS